MKKFKGILNYIFVDGLSGMALGLFATLILGTILDQIASFIPGQVGDYMSIIATVAKSLMGVGIGAGMAIKYKASPLVGVSAAVAGMVGAFASEFLAGTSVAITGKPGDPLSAFIAAFFAIQAGLLISGKTKLDIILTPAASVAAGCAAGLFLGPPASKVTTYIGEIITWAMESHPVIMGVVVSVVMGICLTLPISSAAIGLILFSNPPGDMVGTVGIVCGAAVVGCSAQMVGFAVASYRENKVGGLIAQGIGTSMLQMPNIVRHPQIWIPPIIASAILGPISSAVLKMECTASGAGMGTAGLVGQFMTYSAMTDSGTHPAIVVVEIIVMHFVAPALITLAISEFMRKKKWISFGDMKLENN